MAFLYVGDTRPYSFIQDALDAASDGDVVVIDPGSYGEALTISGAVSLRANTDDPINNPVHVYNSSTSTAVDTLEVTYTPSVPTPIYIEGIKFTRAAVSWARVVDVQSSSNLKIYINKCYMVGGPNQYPLSFNDIECHTIIIKNTPNSVKYGFSIKDVNE